MPFDRGWFIANGDVDPVVGLHGVELHHEIVAQAILEAQIADTRFTSFREARLRPAYAQPGHGMGQLSTAGGHRRQRA